MTGIDQPQMPLEIALDLMQRFDAHHLEVIVDGGWAVDALLGEQTRPHSDLDLAMPHRHVPELRRLLGIGGYSNVSRDDTRECNFVLGDSLGQLVDVHTYTFDERGRLVFGLPYPPGSLTGHGAISSYPVRCITPEWLVKFHTGYLLDENDYHDVRLLCQRFGIQLPEEYAGFLEHG